MRDHLDVLGLGLRRHLLAAGRVAARAKRLADRGTALVFQELLGLSCRSLLVAFGRDLRSGGGGFSERCLHLRQLPPAQATALGSNVDLLPCGSADIQTRECRPSWSTAPENTASVRVAEKLGFAMQRRDCLYVVGRAIPESRRPV